MFEERLIRSLDADRSHRPGSGSPLDLQAERRVELVVILSR
jgi:hypothetical protein